MNSKLAGLLGLCRKSGKLACGATAVEIAIKRKSCFLVIIAEDCGESIKRKISGMCETSGLEYKIMFNKDWLGEAAGLEGKAVIAVKNKDFAQGILKLLNSRA